MPLTPDEFYRHAVTSADEDRRLPLSRPDGPGDDREGHHSAEGVCLDLMFGLRKTGAALTCVYTSSHTAEIAALCGQVGWRTYADPVTVDRGCTALE